MRTLALRPLYRLVRPSADRWSRDCAQRIDSHVARNPSRGSALTGGAGPRRRFLGDLLRATSALQDDVRAITRDVGASIRGSSDAETHTTWYSPESVEAPPATCTASEDDLEELCLDEGIGTRSADVRRLARHSIRLTHARAPAAAMTCSRLGGAPDLPADFDWPSASGRRLGFLGQIALGEAALPTWSTALPPSGLLVFFVEASLEPSGLGLARRSCRVMHVERAGDDARMVAQTPTQFRNCPLVLSRELSLPAEHSLQVRALGLGAAETEAWDRLRERLARLQGVEQHSYVRQAIHRLLGYQDTAEADLELECELTMHGVDSIEALESRRDELESGLADWRLLLQVSCDDALGADWDRGFGSLLLFIREPDLLAHDFTRVCALVR